MRKEKTEKGASFSFLTLIGDLLRVVNEQQPSIFGASLVPRRRAKGGGEARADRSASTSSYHGQSLPRVHFVLNHVCMSIMINVLKHGSREGGKKKKVMKCQCASSPILMLSVSPVVVPFKNKYQDMT